MKAYLIFLLLLIMGAGARTMFEIAYHALGREHGFAPDKDTQGLIALSIWFVLMMVFNVILIRHKELKYRIPFIILLSMAVLIPVGYKFFKY